MAKTKPRQQRGTKKNKTNELNAAYSKDAVPARAPKAAIEKKSPIIAAILSFIITGVGQIYNGEVGKGIVFFILTVGMYTIERNTTIPLMTLIIMAYAVYDAYHTAKKINRGETKL